MSKDFTPELRRELLDDYYAECDELLTALRGGLVQLESQGEEKVPRQETLEGLFRSTHTLKGISAIAGLRPAEELAHGMEDLFRALSRRLLPVSAELVDALLAAVQRLEKIIGSHRQGQGLPEVGDLLAELRSQLPLADKSGPSALERPEEPASDPVLSARQRGLQIYLVVFAPAPELDRRGVNVASVRERLKNVGEILAAKPSILGKNSMVFEFTVGLLDLPGDLASWESDGMRFALVSPPSTSPTMAAESADSPAISLTPSHMMRVDLARLDDLMRITGELVIHRSRLEDRLQGGGGQAGVKEVTIALSRSLRELRETITRIRMVPVAEIFARMPFVVRDLARASEKKAEVVLEGSQTEVDKYLVERLKEPLMHLVRNAFAHGIESVATREAAGKKAAATITLRAESSGESVVIQIRDDGRGVDGEAVRARALSHGLKLPVERGSDGLLEILCSPGFSTRDEADLAAGRGVGMAVVAKTVRELGGTLAMTTELGKGTEFTLRLPLTLSIAEAIMVRVADEIWAVPQNSVDEIIQVSAEAVRKINGTEVIPYRDGLLPIVRLRVLFGAQPERAPILTVLVVRSERGSTGLVVDRIHSQREIVIQRLADPLLRVPGVAGATELGDGRPILILDPAVITRGVVRPAGDISAPAQELAEAIS